MRFIPTGIHAVMDYLLGIVLVGVPMVVGFAPGAETGLATDNAATYVPVVLGVGLIIYSLLTNYELSLAGLIPMRAHLALDALSGAFLAASPWIFGFANYVYLPHVVLGAIEIAAAITTDPETFKRRPAARSTAGAREDPRR
jgi:hypothetical protein